MIITIVKAIPILAAAFLLGNWFLAEVKKAKRAAKPWYTPYLTIPGMLVLLALTLPLWLKILR